MGLTVTGKKLRLHQAELVGIEDLYNNERGHPLPKDKRCHLCWYFGERTTFITTKMGKRMMDFYIIKNILGGDRVVFFPNFDDIAGLHVMGDGDTTEKREIVCLSGLKKCQDALRLISLKDPSENRCFQHKDGRVFLIGGE